VSRSCGRWAWKRPATGFAFTQVVRTFASPTGRSRSFIGTVDEVNPERQQSQGAVSIFGRENLRSELDSSRSRSCSERKLEPRGQRRSDHPKLQLERRQGLTPAPPVGMALGLQAINNRVDSPVVNEEDPRQSSQVIPAQSRSVEDRSFTFVLKTPPHRISLRKGGRDHQGAPNRRSRDRRKGDTRQIPDRHDQDAGLNATRSKQQWR